MISRLKGILVESSPTLAVIECAGVGYDVNIPISTYDKLPPPGRETLLLTVMTVREDDISLYGFATLPEKQLFLLLNTVKGIGTRTALNILSSLNIPSFCQSVQSGDVRSLKKINGVGPKSAERIVVELRDKISSIALGAGVGPAAGETAAAQPADSREMEDALSALENLGYNRLKIRDAVLQVVLALPEGERTVENIIRKSLRALN